MFKTKKQKFFQKDHKSKEDFYENYDYSFKKGILKESIIVLIIFPNYNFLGIKLKENNNLKFNRQAFQQINKNTLQIYQIIIVLRRMQEQTQNFKISDDPQLDLKVSKNQEKDPDISLEENHFQQYFLKAQKNRSNKSWQNADKLYTQEGIILLSKKISQGNLNIKEPSENIDEYLHKIQENNTKQKQLDPKKQKKRELYFQLKHLDSQTSDHKLISAPKFQNSHLKMRILSKQEHQRFIEKVIREKEQKEKHKRQLLQKEQKRRSLTEEKQRGESIKIFQRKKENRRKSIMKSLEKRKQLKQQLLLEQQENEKKYQQIKNKKLLYQQMQERYQTNILVPLIENKKKKLKQIREMRKNLNIQSIISHEKQYLKKKEEQKQSKQEITNFHYQPPEKTNKYKILLEEQKLEQKKILLEKKRCAEEKAQRQQNFSTYIKQNFVPKVDHFKKFQLEEKMNSYTKKRQVMVDGRILGNQYLQIAKKLKKKIKTSGDETNERQLSNRFIESAESETLKDKDEKINSHRTDYLLERKKNSHKLKRSRIQKLIKSQEKSIDKISKLQLESDKLNEAFKRKEIEIRLKVKNPENQSDAIEILLNGIRAKMGILQTINKQHCQTQQ